VSTYNSAADRQTDSVALALAAVDKGNKLPEPPNVLYGGSAEAAAQQRSKKLSDGTNNVKNGERQEQVPPKSLSSHDRQQLAYEMLMHIANAPIIEQGRRKY
jgi:hypothetical protein